jgi:hypothetical protein
MCSRCSFLDADQALAVSGERRGMSLTDPAPVVVVPRRDLLSPPSASGS